MKLGNGIYETLFTLFVSIRRQSNEDYYLINVDYNYQQCKMLSFLTYWFQQLR